MTLPYPVLQTNGISLEAVCLSHAPELMAASADGDLWKLDYTTVPGPDLQSVQDYIQTALRAYQNGLAQAFVVRDCHGKLIGSTRYYDIDLLTPTLAIGYTFYAKSVQRTAVNTTCKLLLLANAFDVLGARAVYFHTSHLNLRSQAAIARIGGQLDGVLRNHKRHKDDSLRNTYTYSILDTEWPALRERLQQRLVAV